MSFQGYVDAAYQATRMTSEEEAEHDDRMFVLGVIEYLDRAHVEADEAYGQLEGIEGAVIFGGTDPVVCDLAGAAQRENALWNALALMRRLHPGLEER